MKKNVKSLFLISGIACLIFASCKGVTDSGSGQYGGGSGDTEINIPKSYGQSELPDLSQASAFSGNAYLRYDNEKVSRDEAEAFFFNNDGTCFIKEADGIAGSSGGNMSYSFRQLSNISYGSYSYNPSTQKLVLKLKAFCYGNKMFSDAQSVVDVKLKLLRQDALVSGYTSVSLPQEWIDAQKNIYARQLSGLQVEYDCSIEDGKLVFDFSGQDDGDYEYYKNSVKFKLYLNDFDIRIENGSYSLENPVIYTMENGRFSGADFKWTFAEKAAVLTKVGDFEGTYELEYGTCYAKLTSVTGDIPYAIKNMVGTEYELKPDKSDSTKRVYKPILKTINYTVIGSDDKVASEQAQFYISNPDMTEWTDGTFKYLSAQYITGIFSNQECTRSVMGKEILDGAGVYVKLKDITAVQYNAQVENFTETSGDGVVLTVQKQCKVKFDLNDGSGNSYEQEFTSGIPFEVSYYNFGNILSRYYSENVYFAGWATERNSTEAMYGKSGNYYETYTLTEDTVLYAVWKKIYSVIIKDPDGVCSDEVCKNTDGEYPVDYVYIGGDVNKPFYKDGYVVVGYAKNKNATEPDYTYGSDIPLSDFGDSTKLVLYVVWKETCTVTYVCDGQIERTENVPKGYAIGWNSTGVSPSTVPYGHKKDGWYKDSEFTDFFDLLTIITENLTIYARIVPISYSVVFNPTGGVGERKIQTFFYNEEKALLTNSYIPPTVNNRYYGTTLGYTSYISSTDTEFNEFYRWRSGIYEKEKYFSDEQIVKNLSTYDGAEINLNAVWQTFVFFGSYPQTIKSDDVIITDVTKTVGSFTLYKGSDDEWYLKTAENAAESDYKYSDGSSVAQYGTSYKYFKVEPIKWRILASNYGEKKKKLLISDKILTSRRFGVDSNNYMNSEIRSWLNGDFCYTAFSDSERNQIAETLVDNSERSTNPDESATKWNNGSNPYACADTEDLIFLLSVQEATRTSYLFEAYDKDGVGSTRLVKVTDYAKAKGVYCVGEEDTEGFWWLRSPLCNYARYSRMVGGNGSIGSHFYEYNNVGVVPALCLN